METIAISLKLSHYVEQVCYLHFQDNIKPTYKELCLLNTTVWSWMHELCPFDALQRDGLPSENSDFQEVS